MEKNKKDKLVKIIFTVCAVLAVCIAVAVAIVMNYQSIYKFIEEKGIFCRKVDVKIIENVKTESAELADLPVNATLDQSLMLINTEHVLSPDFEPWIKEYKDTGVFMNECMISSYAGLSAEVSRKFDKKLYVSSDFRSAEEQAELYEQMPDTATVVGASEHQSGLCLDVYVAGYSGDAFTKSPVGRYVDSKCWEYGFIIRYPSFGEEQTGIRFEPWHIRYVGQPHAKVIYNNHITLEEYISMLEPGAWYSVDGYTVSRRTLSDDGSIEIPSGCEEVIISPDNTGYYIVTGR